MPWDRCYVGELSSASRWREQVVPKPEDTKHRQARPSEPQPPSVTKTTDVALTLAGASPPAEPEAQRTYRGSAAAAGSYVDWATLIRRVCSVDALACTKCGGRLRFIATIIEQPAITKILGSLKGSTLRARVLCCWLPGIRWRPAHRWRSRRHPPPVRLSLAAWSRHSRSARTRRAGAGCS